MRQRARIPIVSLLVVLGSSACGPRDEPRSTSSSATSPNASPASQPPNDPGSNEIDNTARTLVGRLDLEKYKATIKGLTQFGDRRQGTDRNRAAVDWIEAQLKTFGCANTERIKYVYNPPPPAQSPPSAPPPGRVATGG